MPTKLETLRQAGFSTEQIADWAYKERLRMRAEGRNDADIDRDFGVTRPADPDQGPFLQRLKNGLVLQHMIDAAKEHWDRSVGEHPLDSSLANWGFLSRFGPAGQVAATAATDLELASKGLSGVVGGLGAAVGQGLEEALGPGNRPKGTAARDAAFMAEMAPMFSAAMVPARAASIAGPLRTLGSGLAKTFPKATEFQAAAASITGNSKASEMEQQLLQLWREFGVHPLDVAGEVSRNPAIAEAMKSNSARLVQQAGTAESRNPQSPGPSVAGGEVIHASDSRTTEAAEMANAWKARPDAHGTLDPAAAARSEPERRRTGAVGLAGPSDDRVTGQAARISADSGTVDIQDPPLLEQRPFHLDYPGRPQTDGSLRLPRDIEGRELHAQFVAGRRTWGGPDEGLTAKEVTQIMRELAIRVKTMDLQQGTAGRYVKFGVDADNPIRHVHLSPELTPRERDLTKAHELGHALDDFLGWASSKLEPNSKVMDQLRMVYGRVRKGVPGEWFTRQPESYQYTPEQVPKELMADGLRAYIRNPNFFKRVAPDAARMIRELVNEHPVLSKVIQFNSLAGAGILATRPDDDDASGPWQ
jgi:hypothetical protein